MVDAITNTSIIGDSLGSEASASRNKLAKDMDTFLNLLTAQLKAQDPLSPMDSTEFTNQLVLFAQVEQQIEQNENLQAVLASNVKTQQTMAIEYLGSYVEVETDKVMLQDGQAVFTYGLSTEAHKVTVNVKDEDGDIVRTFTGNPTQGLHKVVWDGTDDDGVAVDDGVYFLEVTASEREDAEEDVETWTTSLGKVTGVASDDDATYLAMTDLSVNIDKVLGVFETLPMDDVEVGDTGGTDTGDGSEGGTDDDTGADDGTDPGDDDTETT